jgi:hypothetical protein
MSPGMLRMLRRVRNGLVIAVLGAGSADVALAGLSEAERITLDQPACAQMKSFSRDVTLLNDELQNVRRFKQRGKICDVLGRAATTIGSTVGYMQGHIGECTITPASIDQMATLGRELESDRRKLCR